MGSVALCCYCSISKSEPLLSIWMKRLLLHLPSTGRGAAIIPTNPSACEAALFLAWMIPLFVHWWLAKGCCEYTHLRLWGGRGPALIAWIQASRHLQNVMLLVPHAPFSFREFFHCSAGTLWRGHGGGAAATASGPATIRRILGTCQWLASATSGAATVRRPTIQRSSARRSSDASRGRFFALVGACIVTDNQYVGKSG
jgi:hypothetical protein